MIQKKISFDDQQSKEIEHYMHYGFRDQSDMVRTALQEFIKRAKCAKRRERLEKEAAQFASLYTDNADLAFLTDLDSEEFL